MAKRAWTVLRLMSPPSVNAHTRNAPGKGRVKTAAYAAWRKAAAWEIRAQRPAPIAGHYELRAVIQRTGCDLDNHAKAISDALQGAGVIVNDRLCERLSLEWTDDPAAPECVVSIRPAKAPQKLKKATKAGGRAQ